MSADQDLARLAATLRAPTVAKRATRDRAERVPLAALQVDPDYRRPPDREKIRELVAHFKAGGTVKPLRVNQRPDGSMWITDGQHRAAAAALAGATHANAIVTHLPSQQEPQQCEIVTKLDREQDDATVAKLAGAGASPAGKRLVLNLGAAGTVTYLPHERWVGAGERGTLTASGPDARALLDRLGLR